MDRNALLLLGYLRTRLNSCADDMQRPQAVGRRSPFVFRQVLVTGLLAILVAGSVPVAAVLGQAPAIPAGVPDVSNLTDDEFHLRLIDPTQLVALVGDQPILAGDLLPSINQMLLPFMDKASKSEVDSQRALGIGKLLPRKIDTKLIYLDFLRTVPPDKQKEAIANITKQVDKQFYEEELDKLLKTMEVKSLPELDAKLRSLGSSLERQKMDFRDTAISQFMVSRNINRSPEITCVELLASYRANAEKYDVPARAQWEKLTARFERFPDKAAAERAIVEMGNQVLLGAKLATVAKRLSQGTNAQQGGYHEWTTKGCLVSDVLDHAIFTLPIGQLSRILEDDRGFHIVRVLKREAASRIPFTEAQKEIREQIISKKRSEQVRDYLEKLRKNTFVWTIFDQRKATSPSALSLSQ